MEKYIVIKRKDNGEIVSIIKIIEGQIVGAFPLLYDVSKQVTEETARETYGNDENFETLLSEAKEL